MDGHTLDFAWNKGGSPTVPLEMTASSVVLKGTFILSALNFCQMYIVPLEKRKERKIPHRFRFARTVRLTETLLPDTYTQTLRVL